MYHNIKTSTSCSSLYRWALQGVTNPTQSCGTLQMRTDKSQARIEMQVMLSLQRILQKATRVPHLKKARLKKDVLSAWDNNVLTQDFAGSLKCVRAWHPLILLAS